MGALGPPDSRTLPPDIAQVEADEAELHVAECHEAEGNANAADEDLDAQLANGNYTDDSSSESACSAATGEKAEAPEDFDMMEDTVFDDKEAGAPLADDVLADMASRSAEDDHQAVAGVGEEAAAVAAASGDVLPLPPPPAPVAARGARNQAMFVVFVPGGKLTYYGGRHENLVAECDNPAHGRCVKTKTMRAPLRLNRANRGQGRPVGLLAAWLAKGAAATSKADHWSGAFQPSYAERVAARTALQDMCSADAEGILAGESHDGPEGLAPEPEHIG